MAIVAISSQWTNKYYVGLLDMSSLFDSYVKYLPLNENMKNIFLRPLPLRFLAKIRKVNKITLKSFLKICRSESTLNCKAHHSCININAHNITGVRN